MLDVIQDDSDLQALFADGDDDGLLSALNTADIPIRHTELRTTRWLMLELDTIVDANTGATEADLVLGALQAAAVPRVRAAYDAMSAGGVDLSDPQVQTMIEVIGAGAGWSADLINRLKSAGVTYTSIAQQQLGRDATQADVDAARLQAEKEQRWSGAQATLDAAENEVNAGLYAEAAARLRTLADQVEGV